MNKNSSRPESRSRINKENSNWGDNLEMKSLGIQTGTQRQTSPTKYERWKRDRLSGIKDTLKKKKYCLVKENIRSKGEMDFENRNNGKIQHTSVLRNSNRKNNCCTYKSETPQRHLQTMSHNSRKLIIFQASYQNLRVYIILKFLIYKRLLWWCLEQGNIRI